ncbi:apolipoprotein N-acyltransferase [Persephonella sp.]
MKTFFLSAAGGFLISLSLPDFFIPFAFIGGFFILFFLIYRADSTAKAVFASFLTGLFFSLFSFYWIVFAVNHYGDVSLPLALLMLVVFSVALSLFQFAPFGFLMRTVSRYRYSVYLAPFFWVFLEFVREFFPFTGFPWNLAGYTLSYINPVAQIVSAGSIYALSFLALFFSASVFGVYRLRNAVSTAGVLLSVAVFIGLYVWGNYRINGYTDAGVRKNIAVIQGNIPEDVKQNPEKRVDIINRYLYLMKEASKHNIDLIVLPESAVPVYPLYEPEDVFRLYFFEELKAVKKPVVSGFDNVFYKNGQLYLYNSVFIIDETGKPLDYYSKIKLVPFGEYVPFPFGVFRKLFPYLEGYDFMTGEKQKVLEYKEFKIVPLVCFEAIFPVFVAEFAKKGNIIINVTNDGWFGKTSAPFQHFEMARVRAIENGIYLVRAANTGISAVINPVGIPTSSLKLFEEGIILDRVYLTEKRTFWNKNKNIVGLVFLVLFGISFMTVRHIR